MAEANPIDASSHPPVIRIIEPTNENSGLPHQAPIIDLTGDTASIGSAASSRAVTPVEAYDACFGLVGYLSSPLVLFFYLLVLYVFLKCDETDSTKLCVKATCAQDAKVPATCTPVRIDFERNILRAFLESSEERIAYVISTALLRLVTEFAITLSTTICAKKQRVFEEEEAGQASTVSMFSVRYCSLRIIIYGFLSQKEQVADFLSEENYSFSIQARASSTGPSST